MMIVGAVLQVMSLIDSVKISQLLRLVRECNVMSPQKGPEVTDMDTEGSQDMDHKAQQQLSAVILGNLSKLLHKHGFSGQPEILAALIDVLGEVARSTYASGRLFCCVSFFTIVAKIKITLGTRTMFSLSFETSARQAGQVASAACAALLELLQPIHGVVRETAAAVLRHLMPGLLGLSEPGAAPSDDGSIPLQRSAAAVRSGIIAFAKSAVRYAQHPLLLATSQWHLWKGSSLAGWVEFISLE